VRGFECDWLLISSEHLVQLARDANKGVRLDNSFRRRADIGGSDRTRQYFVHRSLTSGNDHHFLAFEAR